MESRLLKEIKAAWSLKRIEGLAWVTLGSLYFAIFLLWEAVYGDEDDFLSNNIMYIILGIGIFAMAFAGELIEPLRLRKLAKRNSRMKQLMKQLKGQRLPTDRQDHLRKRVPLYSKLPDKLKPKLEERMLLFLEVVEFNEEKILGVTEGMRDIVAAEACLLIINRSPQDYLYLDVIELWEEPIEIDDDGGITLGMAIKGQRVQLYWREVYSSLGDGEDNHNLILHEFAHILDFAGDAECNSIPVEEDSPDYQQWKSMLEHEYPRLRKAHASGQGHVIRDYSISRPNQAEFFSCATESFFERPSALKEKHPAIYGCMKNFYRLDPAEW
mgnify:CR=1 FL=1